MQLHVIALQQAIYYIYEVNNVYFSGYHTTLCIILYPCYFVVLLSKITCKAA